MSESFCEYVINVEPFVKVAPCVDTWLYLKCIKGKIIITQMVMTVWLTHIYSQWACFNMVLKCTVNSSSVKYLIKEKLTATCQPKKSNSCCSWCVFVHSICGPWTWWLWQPAALPGFQVRGHQAPVSTCFHHQSQILCVILEHFKNSGISVTELLQD